MARLAAGRAVARARHAGVLRHDAILGGAV